VVENKRTMGSEQSHVCVVRTHTQKTCKTVIRNGIVLEGELTEHNSNGYKKITMDGDVFEGKFRLGKLHGKGKITFASGQVQEGEFVAGKLVKGMMLFADGDIHEGEFRNDILSKKGKITFSNGDVFIGVFNGTNAQGMMYPLSGAQERCFIKNLQAEYFDLPRSEDTSRSFTNTSVFHQQVTFSA
jgi:hypothetical protein